MNKPLVSIRCATYNHAPYIRQCLDGFVMQKTDFCFEAIVHDDASTDGTADIIREYAAKYPDIIKPIYETENQYSKHDGSLARIMNAHMHGKYIAFCEGDDYWTDPLKLQKQVDLLEKNAECSMCCCGYIRRQKGENDIIRSMHSDDSFFIFSYKDWERQWLANPLTWVYRNDALTEYNEKIVNYKYNRDIHLLYHLLKGRNGIYIPDVMAVYNLHSGGVCSSLPLSGKAVQSYNCYKELYLNNKDESLRKNYANSINRMLLFNGKTYPLLKEGWSVTKSVMEKAKLLCSFIMPDKVYFILKRIVGK